MPVTVEYQTQYEVCALLFLLAATARFFFSRRFPGRLNRLYGMILVCAILDLTLDILGAYTIPHANVVPGWVNHVINTVFYSLQICLSAMMMTYVIAAAGKSYRQQPLLRLLLLPFAGFMLLMVTNPFTKCIFYLQEIDGRIYYCHGPLFPFLYVDTALYSFFTLCLVIAYRKKLDSRQRHTVLAFLGILVLALVAQYFFPDVLLTGVAIALAMLLMFFTLQNPDDMLDSISGAFNYNAMMLYLDAAMRQQEPLRMIIVDIGGIRRINSSFGLLVGNRIFSSVGAFFNGLGAGNWVFRMVGTRFLLVIDRSADFSATVTRVREAFEKNWKIEDREIHLVATIRYFDALDIFASPEELISLIDDTYASISSGNWGRCEPIDQAALERSHRNMQIETALRAALHKGEGLSLCYQPIYNAQAGGFTTAEALLRFSCPELGSVSPNEFIPMAEKCGLIFQIDAFVLNAACQYLQRHDAFEYLEVNLSAAEFFRNPAQQIHAIVTRYGVEPGRICFEVTETAADTYPAMLSAFMQEMIGYGYRFALDDFGTGYSNITKVAQLPFNIAKIDKALISEEKKVQTLFDSITRMFASIGVLTVAEGVETRQQLAAILPKVDFVQGFYYARPMPEAELGEFLQKMAMKAGNTHERLENSVLTACPSDDIMFPA